VNVLQLDLLSYSTGTKENVQRCIFIGHQRPLLKWQNHFTHLKLFGGKWGAQSLRFLQIWFVSPSAAGPVPVWHGVGFHSCHFCPNFP